MDLQNEVYLLIDRAANALFEGEYNHRWIRKDSAMEGACGGRNLYRWRALEEENILLLLHRKGGVPQGLDGENTQWSMLVAVRYQYHNSPGQARGYWFEELTGGLESQTPSKGVWSPDP